MPDAQPIEEVDLLPDADAGAGDPPDADGDKGSAKAVDKASDDKGGDDDVKGFWPDDWRQNIAGDDKGRLKSLERYTDPKALADAHEALRARMDSGEFLTPFPADGNDDVKTSWRKANNIPEKAEGYLDKMPDGLVIGEADKEIATEFAEAMHEMNASPEIVHKALAIRYKMLEMQQADVIAGDEEDSANTHALMISQSGPKEHTRNIAGLKSYLEKLPGDLGEAISTARSGDGMALMNQPEFIKIMLDEARRHNPDAFRVVAPSGSSEARGISDEMASIEKLMGDKDSDYWKGPRSKELRERYVELVESKQDTKAA